VAEVNVVLERKVHEIRIRCLPVGQDNQVQGLQRAWSWSYRMRISFAGSLAVKRVESAASTAKHGARAVFVRLASGVTLRRLKWAAPTSEHRLLIVHAVGVAAFLPNMVVVMGYLGAQLAFESTHKQAHFLPQWSVTVCLNSSAIELRTNGLAGKNFEFSRWVRCVSSVVQKQDIHAVGVEF
jgi:hypothetical protein